MDRHLDVIFIADGHDLLEEILQVVEKIVARHVFVLLEELLDVRHSLGLPAGHHSAVHVACDGFKHLLGNQFVDCFLGICEAGGAVRKDSGQLGPCPVEDGHEVVAYKVDILFSEVLQGLDVVRDQLVAGGLSELDVLMYVDALDTGEVEACCLDFVLHRADPLAAPHFAGHRVVQGRDNAGHAGNLPDLLQGN